MFAEIINKTHFVGPVSSQIWMRVGPAVVHGQQCVMSALYSGKGSYHVSTAECRAGYRSRNCATSPRGDSACLAGTKRG